MEQNWFMDLVRGFFAFLDRIVYGLIPVAYNLLMDISKYKIFSDTDISDVGGRIYTILGIFMLFKVSFSFVSYIVNPDSMTDKERGIQKIITNVVIMFVMLVMCPWAFKQLWGLQDAILKENLVGALVFGEGSAAVENQFKWDICDDNDPLSKAASTGDYISIQVLRGFYQPMTLEDIGYDLSNANYDTDYYKVKSFMCQERNSARSSDYLVNTVYNAKADVNGWTMPIFGKDLDFYVINYRIIISTATGVVILLILVGFCMDVGLRMVKLSFLEIIAPIPIISYIDPTSGKNGIFKKWIKEVGTTWVSIFIRLLALFFATMVIQKVGSLINVETGETGEASIWVYIFVIIGALMFAKKLPTIIQNIFGIKLDGGFSLNPLKKVQEQALFGKQIAGLTTAAVGMGATGLAQAAANQYAFVRDRHNLKKQIATEQAKDDPDAEKIARLQNQVNHMKAGRLVTTSVGGLVGGARHGMVSGYKTGSKGSINVLKNVSGDLKEGNRTRNNRTAIREYNREVGRTGTGDKYTWGERNIIEKADNLAGVKNEFGGYGFYQKQIEDLNRKIEDNNSKENALRNQFAGVVVRDGQDSLMLEKIHKAIKELGSSFDVSTFATQNSMSLTTAQNLETYYHSKVETVLDNIDKVNASTKELKKNRRQYQDMVDARKQAENKKG